MAPLGLRNDGENLRVDTDDVAYLWEPSQWSKASQMLANAAWEISLSTDFDLDNSRVDHDCYFSKMMENIRWRLLALSDGVKNTT